MGSPDCGSGDLSRNRSKAQCSVENSRTKLQNAVANSTVNINSESGSEYADVVRRIHSLSMSLVNSDAGYLAIR